MGILEWKVLLWLVRHFIHSIHHAGAVYHNIGNCVIVVLYFMSVASSNEWAESELVFPYSVRFYCP